jgi:hypothetical protein
MRCNAIRIRQSVPEASFVVPTTRSTRAASTAFGSAFSSGCNRATISRSTAVHRSSACHGKPRSKIVSRPVVYERTRPVVF